MKKLLLILFLLPLFIEAQNNVYTFTAADGTAMKRYDTTITGWNARVLMRADQFSNPDSNEVIIDMVGLGEVGSDTSKISVSGYGYWISNARWDGTVTLASGNHHPIIIVLQPSSAWPGESTTSGKIDVILGRWRIKRRAVHLSGLSMGGWMATTLVTSDASSPYARAFKVTSIVESGGANPNENTPYPDLFDRFATVGARGTGGKLLSFQQDLDGRDALNRVNRMNSNAAGSFYIQTNFGARGHSNFNDHYNPSTTNWTTSNAEVTSTTPAGGLSVSMAQWQLLQGDTTTNWDAPGSLVADAGTDTAYLYDQGGVAVPFTLSGSAFNATSPTYSWAALAGNPASTTITSSSSASTTVTGANVPGFYGYELTVTDGTTAKDTVYMQLRDIMQRGVRPCRVGTPQRFYIGDSLAAGRVTTTEFYLQYITRDGFLTGVLGYDTVVVLKNPNDPNGWWTSGTLGDISGGPGCPIVFVPDTSGITRVSAAAGGTRGWYIANADTNTMAYVKFDGGAWYNRTGIRHGFRADNSQYSYDSSDVITNSLNTGIAAQLIHHVEFTGWAFNNTGHGIQMKKNSDSTKQFTIWNNFRQVGNAVRYSYFYKTNYEGIYAGHTDWNGTSQVGNDGRTLMQDSLVIEKNVFHKTGLDGIQVANHGNGAIVRDNVVYQSGYRNGSSHRWSIFIGGNANGDMYRNTIVNARGPAGSLGSGTVQFYQNIIDSVNDGGNVESGMYVNKSAWTGNTDSLKIRIYNNIISRVSQTGNYSHIYVVNSAGLMGKGLIADNVLVSSKGTNIQTAASDTLSNNTVVSSLDLDASSLAGMDSYRVYKVLRASAAGTPISFYDLQIVRQFGGRKQLHRGRKFNFKYK